MHWGRRYFELMKKIGYFSPNFCISVDDAP